MEYSFSDHLHNYAVWTAARSVQRGYTNTKNIKAAIEKTELQKIANNGGIKTSKEFDEFHRKTANILIKELTGLGVPTTYGRAAKIIAVYLKTSVVIRDKGESQLSKIVHPPIDNILLTNLAKINTGIVLRNIKWSKLSEFEYFELIAKLRSLNMNSFWKIEKYWTPIQG